MDKKQKSLRTQVIFSRPLADWLDGEARRRGLTRSEMLRRLIDDAREEAETRERARRREDRNHDDRPPDRPGA